MFGLAAVIGQRRISRMAEHFSQVGQEEHMGRKLEVMAAKAGALQGTDALEREDVRLGPDLPLKEQVIFTGSSDWTPEQAEHYIDWRIQLVDTEIARLREQLNELTGARKRWLAVTGGRSKMFANGNGNGNANGATTGA